LSHFDLDPDDVDENSPKYFDEDKFIASYFVLGGRIRRFMDFYENGADKSAADTTINRVSTLQAELSLSVQDCRSTNDHVNSLRTMFRVPNGSADSVNLHVDSQYMLRGLREKISCQELFGSYKKAELEKNRGSQANYFEEMMQSVLDSIDPKLCQHRLCHC
jgi:hypothetical protein